MTDNREIQVTDIKGISIGHASNQDAGTGVTVLYFPNGAKAGCDISGGGPASRETPLTSPLTADNPINAIVLSGGSAYGLAASDGVMTCLEEHGIGYPTGLALVPLVFMIWAIKVQRLGRMQRWEEKQQKMHLPAVIQEWEISEQAAAQR